ncbi:MAG: hypothetical protein KDA90_23670, partial [Planctomycetaceae bacterium]|nr:hypothetical protein [Planctomycetaceae bacterium]
TSERQLYRDRQRAGFRIGDGNRVDLVRYTAWLAWERHNPKPAPTPEPYEQHKDRAARRSAELSAAGRDIGDLPAIADPARRTNATTNFQFFCEAYFPQSFHLAWSDDHRKVLRKIQQAVLHGGLFAMAMPRGSGKALALDTPLPTPDGWTTMGEVEAGDVLFDECGQPCLVTFATPVQHGRPCYRVTFSDGESIVCDGDHLWSVEDRWSRQNPLVIPTQQMVGRVELPTTSDRKERRYRVPVTRPLRCFEQDLPVHPYLLGYWLGDGSRRSNRITVHEDDLAELLSQMESCGENAAVRTRKGKVVTVVVGKGHKASLDKSRRLRQSIAAIACGVEPQLAADWSGLSSATVACVQTLDRWTALRQGKRSSLMVRLRELGVLDEKGIPDQFLRSAPWQRLALLQGLMDSDGTIQPGGRCEITLKDDSLGRAVGDLLGGLGIKWTCHEKWVTRKDRRFGPYLRYLFTAPLDLPVFRLQRKKRRLTCVARASQTVRYRQIVSIEPAPSVPVKCIQVNSPSQLYLAGRKMVPTHNTTICECACIWAVLNGHREFVCLIGSDEGHAMDMLESIKTEL